ncbi:MAG TPA: hypothetical protein VFU89_07865 [Rhabdochlamydiaceae bacterium]|nr:hypothetical protein [Rhabdochlamydiaceae bacterium]
MALALTATIKQLAPEEFRHLPERCPPCSEGTLPSELWQHIFSFAVRDENLKNGLVCHEWRVLTIKALEETNHQNLEQLIPLLIKQEKYALFQKDFEKISQSFRTSLGSSTIPEQVDISFWKAKSMIVRILKKVTQFDQWWMNRAVASQISNSLRDIFELAKLPLEMAICRNEYETFFIVLSSCTPLPSNEIVRLSTDAANQKIVGRSRIFALEDPVFFPLMEAQAYNDRPKIKSLLLTANENTRCVNAQENLRKGDCELFQFALGLITASNRQTLVESAIEMDKFEFVQPLHPTTASAFSDYEWGVLLEKAINKNNLEILRSLLDLRESYFIGHTIEMTISNNQLEAARLLLDYHSIPACYLTSIIQKAIEKNKLEFVRLLLAHGRTWVTGLAKETLTNSNLTFSTRLTIGKLLLKNVVRYPPWETIIPLILFPLLFVLFGSVIPPSKISSQDLEHIRSLAFRTY